MSAWGTYIDALDDGMGCAALLSQLKKTALGDKHMRAEASVHVACVCLLDPEHHIAFAETPM